MRFYANMFREWMAISLILAVMAAPAFGAEKEFQVGFVYVSPVGDAGWPYSHDQARKVIDELPGVTTSSWTWRTCPRDRTPNGSC